MSVKLTGALDYHVEYLASLWISSHPSWRLVIYQSVHGDVRRSCVTQLATHWLCLCATTSHRFSWIDKRASCAAVGHRFLPALWHRLTETRVLVSKAWRHESLASQPTVCSPCEWPFLFFGGTNRALCCMRPQQCDSCCVGFTATRSVTVNFTYK